MKRLLLIVCLAPALLLARGKGASEPGAGYLKVDATPDKAGVFLDGVYMGPAARFGRTRKYTLPPGSYKITLVDPRCEDAEATVTIEAGKTATVTQALKPKAEPKGPYGTLKIICPYDNVGAVMLNNHYVGHVSEFDGVFQGLLIAPGTYDVRIDMAGGESLLWEKVVVAADKTTVVTSL
jgi:hypothetical protein